MEDFHAEKGHIDLSDVVLHEGKIIKLNGEWEFYWNELFNPDELSNKKADHYFDQINRIWNNYDYDGMKLPGTGYATFRLTANIHEEDIAKPLAIYIPYIHTAYSIFINGEHLDSVGKVGKSKTETSPKYHPKIIFFTPKSDTIEIVFHVSNFAHNKGGFSTPLLLGDADQLYKYKEKKIASSLFLSGTFFIIGFYHFTIFIYRTTEKSSLYFSIFSFLIASRILLIDDIYLVQLFPNLSWMFEIKLEYFIISGGFLVYLLFIKSLYSKEVNQIIFRIIMTICSIYCLMSIFTPPFIFTYLFRFFSILSIIFIGYFIYVMILALIRKQEGALISCIAGMIFYYTIINDILYNLGWIKEGKYILALGFIIFIFSQSLVLSKKYATTFKKVAQLNKELQLLNESLEEKVHERTESLKRTMQETASAVAEKSILEERSRLVRDIHDTVGHTLTTVNVQIEAGKRLISKDPEKAIERFNASQDMVRTGLDEIRRLLQVLKSSDLSHSFIETIQNLIEKTQFHTNVIIDDDINLQSPLTIQQQHVLFRALQEGLTNGLRHGKCKHFYFELKEEDRHVHFFLKDDGQGTDKLNYGLGLSSMKERVEELNGTMEIHSERGKGFTIKIILPIEKTVQSS